MGRGGDQVEPDDKAGKGAGVRLRMLGYGSTEVVLAVARCHQRLLSGFRAGAAWGTD